MKYSSPKSEINSATVVLIKKLQKLGKKRKKE
jgi:hypothetical protein